MSTSNTTQAYSDWIVFPKPNPQAKLRLFCFPYAGGAASVYRSWPEGCPAEIEICSVQLPGRESRWREPRFTAVGPLIQALSGSIRPFLDRPFAFFGHSLGALVAFELARRLRREGATEPVYLFVSGRRAPHLPNPKPPIHDLPDSKFIDSLKQLNGTPDEIFQNPEALQLFLPVLRDDFAINETYSYALDETLEIPIWAFGGLSDEEAKLEDLQGWDAHTAVSFSLRMFPGDHFFLHGNRAALTRLIFHRLASSIRPPRI